MGSGSAYTVNAPAYEPGDDVIRVKIINVDSYITTRTGGTFKRVNSIYYDTATGELVYIVEN